MVRKSDPHRQLVCRRTGNSKYNHQQVPILKWQLRVGSEEHGGLFQHFGFMVKN